MVNEIWGERLPFKSADSVTDVDTTRSFPTEFHNSINLSYLPEHALIFKVNTVVIQLRNMHIPTGYCNGIRYIIKRI